MSDPETCHVVVLGFDPQLESPATRLQRVFGLDAATCEALLENLPATVQRAVPRVRAEYFRRALLSIGAQVEVRSPSGEVLAAEAPPAPPAPAPASASKAPAAPVATAASAPPPDEARARALALHVAPTEPLPSSGWAAEPSPWTVVDATSQTLTQQQQADLGVAPWAMPAPAQASPSAVEPTAFGGAAPAPAAWQPPPPLAQPPSPIASPWSQPTAPLVSGAQGAPLPWSPPAPGQPAQGLPASPGGLPGGAPSPFPSPAAPTVGAFPAAQPAAAPQPAAPAAAGRADPTAWASPPASAAPPAPEVRAPAAPTLREAAAPLSGRAPGAAAAPARPAAPAAFQPAQAPAAPGPGAAPSPFGHAPSPGAPAFAPAAAPPFAPPSAAAPFAPPAFGAGHAAPSPWAGGLDLSRSFDALLAQPVPGSAAPFALAAGSAPVPVAPGGGAAPPGVQASAGAKLPPNIWDAPSDSSLASRDPSGVFDPPAEKRASGRPPALRSSAPPPPAALERALRSSPPPPPAGRGATSPVAPSAGDSFQVLHGWQEMREEFRPDSGPKPRKSAAPAATRARPAGAAGSSLPAASPPAAASSGGAASPRAPARAVGAGDARSFWQSLSDALSLPFSGPGPYWIAGLVAWAVAVGALGLLSGVAAIFGALVTFCGCTSLLAMACDYFRACFWAPATGARELDRGPDFDPVRVARNYVGRGLFLSSFFVLSQIAAIAWIVMSVNDVEGAPLSELLVDPVTWLLIFFPYCYWPAGVALTSLQNDFAAIWNVIVVARAILRAPIEYFVVVLLSFAALAGTSLVLLRVGEMLGLSGPLLIATLGLPLALSHGVGGALMGHLARARSEIFEE